MTILYNSKLIQSHFSNFEIKNQNKNRNHASDFENESLTRSCTSYIHPFLYLIHTNEQNVAEIGNIYNEHFICTARLVQVSLFCYRFNNNHGTGVLHERSEKRSPQRKCFTDMNIEFM